MRLEVIVAIHDSSCHIINNLYKKTSTLKTDLLLNPNVLLFQSRPHHEHKPHRLDQLGIPMILPHPILSAHNHQLVEHQIIPATNVTIAPLLKSPNSVSPECIIIVEVIEGFVLPGIYIRALGRDNDRGNNEKSMESSLVCQITPKIAHKPHSLKDMFPPANGSRLLCSVACLSTKSIA